MDEQIIQKIDKFPRTRFMGSKQKLLHFIYDNIVDLEGDRVLDAFCGSACVSYLFKSIGKEVHTNDFMRFCYMIAKATIENNKTRLNHKDIELLLEKNSNHELFITNNFKDLYFKNDENRFLDQTYANIQLLNNEYKRAIALTSLARACLKKRPRGVFTYTGMRYDDGRRDLRITFKEQLIVAIEAFNQSIFHNNKKNKSFNKDIFELPDNKYDIIYIDPPYFTPHSDNDYTRRYHFLEGLMSYWKHVKINNSTKTKKFNKFVTPFDCKQTVYDAFDKLFEKFHNSTYVVSYSSNSLPTLKEMINIMKKYKSEVRVEEYNHRYSFGTQKSNLSRNAVNEYLFIGSD